MLDLFPEIGLHAPKLHFRQGIYLKLTKIQVYTNIPLAQWSDSETRRYFLEKYAKDNDFDPLIAQNWYSEPKDKILRLKVSIGEK